MNRRTIWGGVFALLILQACENKTPEGVVDNHVTNEVTFTSTIDNLCASRAYDGSWEANDQIGIFMLASENGNVLDNNVSYITAKGDGNFLGYGGVIRFPEDGTQKVDFVAYYPYADATDGLDYAVDVTDQSRQNAIDLMVSNNLKGRDISNLQTGNNLQFTHMLSKLVLNLNATDNGSLEGLKVSVVGTKTKASVSLKNKTLSAQGNEADVAMYINKECTQAEAILVPQTISGKLKLRLEINGKTKEVETHVENELLAGMKYTFTVHVSGAGSQVDVDPEAKYAKWTETPVITESQQAKSNIRYINHYGPDDEKVRNYSMLYDTDLKIAYWVAYPLCNYYLKGDGKRTDDWGFDPEISSSLQANLNKGFSDNYDRGHQLPSADRMRSNRMNATTFYYTNMTPQIGQGLNQTIWAALETAVRGWCSGTDTLYVVTGAMPTTQTDTHITYTKDNSGSNVAIPKYYFKALARRLSSTGSYQTIAFKMDQKKYSNSNYSQCAISVNELEELTGFTFFPNIDDQYKNNSNVW